MFRNGKYAVWFRTSLGQGTGMLYLADGKISGNDSFFAYAGSYEVDQNRFSATLTTRRYSPGPTTTVFGRDEVEVKASGIVKDATVWCFGTSDQAPDIDLEATLIPCREDEAAPEMKHAPANFKLGKLPRERDARHRARNPFAVRPPG